MESLSSQKDKYRMLAYVVVRDAIAFYYGIPKFLASTNVDEVVANRVANKLKNVPNPTDKQVSRQTKMARKAVNDRLAYLKEDLEHCKMILFQNNVWLSLLDLNPDFFKVYLNRMSPEMQDELAIVPRWSERDDRLQRPYLQTETKEINF